jgi:hypothetical protein
MPVHIGIPEQQRRARLSFRKRPPSTTSRSLRSFAASFGRLPYRPRCCARRRPTSRSAVASGRGQDRNAMTFVTASPRPRLPRSPNFGVALLSPRCLPRHLLHRRPGQKSPNPPRRQRQTRYRDRRSRRLHPRTHLQPNPPPRQIPIDGNRPPGGPRVPSWGAFGRPPCSTARARAGIRNPSPKRTLASRSRARL